MPDQLKINRIITLHWHPWMSPECRCRACEARRELEHLFELKRGWQPWEMAMACFLAKTLCTDIAERKEVAA